MWYLIVSIPDLCTITYLDCFLRLDMSTGCVAVIGPYSACSHNTDSTGCDEVDDYFATEMTQ